MYDVTIKQLWSNDTLEINLKKNHSEQISVIIIPGLMGENYMDGTYGMYDKRETGYLGDWDA